jgi:hypothetical protein
LPQFKKIEIIKKLTTLLKQPQLDQTIAMKVLGVLQHLQGAFQAEIVSDGVLTLLLEFLNQKSPLKIKIFEVILSFAGIF